MFTSGVRREASAISNQIRKLESSSESEEDREGSARAFFFTFKFLHIYTSGNKYRRKIVTGDQITSLEGFGRVNMIGWQEVQYISVDGYYEQTWINVKLDDLADDSVPSFLFGLSKVKRGLSTRL